MITILNQMAEKWYGWELAMLWQAGLLIAIVAAIDLLIKKWAWPQVRYALWLLILVKLILPPSLTSPTSFTAEIPFMIKQAAVKINQPQIEKQIAESTNSDIKPIPVVVVPKQVEIASPEARNDEILRFTQNDNRAQNDNRTRNDVAVPATAKQLITWKGYLMFVWAGGVAILAGWLVIRLHGLRREHLEDESQILPERLEGLLAATGDKLNLRRIPQVILTDKVCCPAVFGVFRPVLLMPADKLQNMTAQDAENIFLHELAHIKRGDLLVHAIYMILQIAYWFNPLVWLARKPLQNLRELCCDATVARMLREKTAGYRQTLLETARELLAVPVDPGLGLLGLFENSSWLLDRLRWLEKKSWKYRPLRIATVFVLICLMSACVLPMAKFQAPADFVIRGTVTDAQTGKPIAGAKVGDTEEYADGKFCTISDANGDYSYKTWYEEHGIKAIAEGYQKERKTLLTKVFGSEKEKVINFALEQEKSSGGVDYASVIVKEGIGFEDIIVGDGNCTIEFLKARLGRPEEEIKDKETNGYWITYIKKYGLDFWFDEQKILYEIRLDKGFKGKLKSGISMYSSQKDVFAIYGKPISEEFTDNHLPKRRGDQILFKLKGAENSKIYYDHKGILFWFDGDSIKQIVIHPSITEPIGQEGNRTAEQGNPDVSRAIPMNRDSGSGTGEDVSPGKTTDPVQIKNIMITMGGIFNAARTAIQSPGGGTKPAAKIMEDALPQFEKFESAIEGTNISDSVHLIIEQIRQAIKANKEGDSPRVAALIGASGDSWNQLTNVLVNEISENKQEARYKESMQKMEKESQKPAGQEESKDEKSRTSEMNSKIDKFDIDNATRSDVIKVFGEPTKYIWGEQVFEKNNLPDRYIMVYPDSFRVFIMNDRIIEFRFEGPSDYVFGDGLVVGSSIEKAFSILGQPSETVEGKPNEFKDNVLYKDIDGRKGRGYYTRPEKNIRIWISDDKVCAIYLTRSNFRGSAGGGKELKEAELPKTSFIDKDGHIVDKIDYPFITDTGAIGGWESVDFVRNIEDFKPGNRSWADNLFLKELFLLEGGKTNLGFTWTKGLILHSVSKTASKYIIREIDGSKYMFMEWKSGDYTIRHTKPAYYVLKQNENAVYVKSRTIDEIDYPFVNDARVLGKWESVDFVDEIEQFQTGNKHWKGGNLFLHEMIFERGGRLTSKNDKVPTGYSQSWTKGLVISEENKTASRYIIKQINDDEYLFFEWKSGDYTIRGMKPKYYVLKKITSQEDIDRNLPLELKAFDEWSTANFRKYLDCDGNNWLADYEEKTIQQLNGSKTDDYYSAINRLACMRSKKAVPLIAAIAFDKREKDNRDRWMATRALGLIGEKTAIGDLIHLMYHYNNNTRLYARVSLIRLGCKDLGPDWRRWAAWYKYKIDNHFSTRKIEWTKDRKLADERLQIQEDQSWLKNLKDDWEIKNKYRQ